MRKFLLTTAAVGVMAVPAMAEVSDGKVKIGILNDQSGVYADFGGKNSVEAAKMAIEDFGGKVLDAPIEPGQRRPSKQARHRLEHCPAMV